MDNIIHGLSQDASYLRTGVKGCSKIRHVLAKSRLISDEMCRLYAKFASYFSSYIHLSLGGSVVVDVYRGLEKS